MKYTLKKLNTMPTIHQGQYDNLKLGTKDTRVWLSRMTIEDGMLYNNQVTTEKLLSPVIGYDSLGRSKGRNHTVGKTWQIIEQYEAK